MPNASLNFSSGGFYVLLKIIPHFYESPHPRFPPTRRLTNYQIPVRYTSFTASQFKFSWEGLLKLYMYSSTLWLISAAVTAYLR